jgi:hypothetical protein
MAEPAFIKRQADMSALETSWETIARMHTCLLGWNFGQVVPAPLENNGTCCLIQTNAGRFVVTCEHVWKQYDIFRNDRAGAQLWIGLVRSNQEFAPSDGLILSNPKAISVNENLDLAVFTFDEINHLESWRFWQIQADTISKTKKADIVHFLGFPGAGIREGTPTRILNYCFSSQTIHDVSYNRFVLHSAPGEIHHMDKNGENTGAFRICGASGAPVFKVEPDFHLSLAGIIFNLSSSGLRGEKDYQMSDGDIYVTHAHFIQENGSIIR